ncbi:Venom serine carboxypeptidase [Frankliniella fusca]|uniref:Carboxypeptidase n=1 Tax=Frankliniella fusca TaxID=407009 RepID=A0AAE1LS52_9NEOP|nr:Venom serine carboxypeptidase [Frankliniella fusca]
MMRPVFLENGPYQIDPRNMQLRRRRAAWTRAHSVLYFDNPVGTGYSFTRGPEGLSRNVRQVARSLVEALRQFFVMFPGQRRRDLYIAGESYGGKMATALAHEILHADDGDGALRLKGLIIINALVEAESQVDKSEVAYQLGVVDEEGRDEMRTLAARQIQLIQQGHWDEARKLSKDECGGTISPEDTGLAALSNYLLWNGTQDNGYKDFAQHRHIRRALHVGNVTFAARASAVSRALSDDAGVSQLPQLAEVADSIRVLVVSGQLDLCLPYRLTASLLRKMAWSGAAEMTVSRRVTWCERGQLAGYARTVRNLTHVLVRNAGHYLGQDQPRWAAAMLARFTGEETFDTCEGSLL